MELDTGFWYFVSFAIFVGAAAGPLKKIITEALNNTAIDISKDLNEAGLLKAEAEALLVEAKQHQADAEQNAKDIREHAEKEAARLHEQAMLDVSAFVKQQKIHLEDRIKQLEVTAVNEIHHHMIEVAIDTAQAVVKKSITIEKDQTITAHELKKLKHLG